MIRWQVFWYFTGGRSRDDSWSCDNDFEILNHLGMTGAVLFKSHDVISHESRSGFDADAHRDDGKRFVVRGDETLTGFLELQRITHGLALSSLRLREKMLQF